MVPHSMPAITFEGESSMSSFHLPMRSGDPPVTGKQPPQLQFSDQSPRSVYQKMAIGSLTPFHMHEKNRHAYLCPPQELYGWDEKIKASPSSFMPPPGSREFAHLHEDGSFHLVMSPEDESEVIDKGWGLHHPWKNRGVNENPALCATR